MSVAAGTRRAFSAVASRTLLRRAQTLLAAAPWPGAFRQDLMLEMTNRSIGGPMQRQPNHRVSPFVPIAFRVWGSAASKSVRTSSGLRVSAILRTSSVLLRAARPDSPKSGGSPQRSHKALLSPAPRTRTVTAAAAEAAKASLAARVISALRHLLTAGAWLREVALGSTRILRKVASKLLWYMRAGVQGLRQTISKAFKGCFTAVKMGRAAYYDRSLLTEWWVDVRASAGHMVQWVKTGSLLFWKNIKICCKLLLRRTQGHDLSLREHKLLIRTTTDLLKMGPFSLFVLIPFAELALPVALKVFPNMLPSTFLEKSHVADDLEAAQKRFRAKREMAHFFQEVIEEKNKRVLEESVRSSATAELQDKMIELKRFQAKLLAAGDDDRRVFPSAKELLQFAALFRKEFTLENMSLQQLQSMCKLLGLVPYSFHSHVVLQLRHYVARLRNEDRHIMWEGVDELSRDELVDACRSRGMPSTTVTEQQMRDSLHHWLALSSIKDIPISLLLWSRTFYYTNSQQDRFAALQGPETSFTSNATPDAKSATALETREGVGRPLETASDFHDFGNDMATVSPKETTTAAAAAPGDSSKAPGVEASMFHSSAERRRERASELEKRLRELEAMEQESISSRADQISGSSPQTALPAHVWEPKRIRFSWLPQQQVPTSNDTYASSTTDQVSDKEGMATESAVEDATSESEYKPIADTRRSSVSVLEGDNSRSVDEGEAAAAAVADVSDLFNREEVVAQQQQLYQMDRDRLISHARYLSEELDVQHRLVQRHQEILGQQLDFLADLQRRQLVDDKANVDGLVADMLSHLMTAEADLIELLQQQQSDSAARHAAAALGVATLARPLQRHTSACDDSRFYPDEDTESAITDMTDLESAGSSAGVRLTDVRRSSSKSR